MTVYDAEGQLLTGSYMDYALPRATDVPAFTVDQPSGAGHDQSARRQGLRRGRLRRRLTSVMNAVVDALSEYGIRHIDMPATPVPGLAGDPRRRRGLAAAGPVTRCCIALLLVPALSRDRYKL